MKKQFCNISVKKKKYTKKNHSTLTNLGKHLWRTAANIYKFSDEKRRCDNEILLGEPDGSLTNMLNKFLKKYNLETRNTTTVQAYQIVFSIPKSYFGKPELIKEFKKQVVEMVNENPIFKDNCLSLVYHGDETQPHIQGVFVPRANDNKLNFKHLLGGPSGPQKIHKLHDELAERLAPIGLHRGDGTHTKNLTEEQYKKGVASLEAPLPIDPVPKRPAKPSKRELITHPLDYFNQVRSYQEELEKQNSQLRGLAKKSVFYETQNQQLKSVNQVLKKQLRKRQGQTMKLTNERKEQLRQIPCNEVLEKLGLPVKAEGTTYRCKTEDLNIVINSENKFTENKSDVQGFGAISLLVDVFKYKFLDAIRLLSNEYGIDKTTLVAFSEDKHTKALAKNNVEKIKREIPKPVSKNLINIFNYLTQKRKIDKKIIQDLSDKDLLFADKFNNCVFLNEDKDFAFLRGTHEEKRFVSVVGEPDFIKYEFGKSTDTYLFESVIDALSFKTMFPEKEGKYIVLNGSMLMNRIHEVIDQNSKLHLCFDNDEQGEKFCAKIKDEVVNEIIVIKPLEKDFNEDLINGTSTKPSSTTKPRNF